MTTTISRERLLVDNMEELAYLANLDELSEAQVIRLLEIEPPIEILSDWPDCDPTTDCESGNDPVFGNQKR